MRWLPLFTDGDITLHLVWAVISNCTLFGVLLYHTAAICLVYRTNDTPNLVNNQSAPTISRATVRRSRQQLRSSNEDNRSKTSIHSSPHSPISADVDFNTKPAIAMQPITPFPSTNSPNINLDTSIPTLMPVASQSPAPSPQPPLQPIRRVDRSKKANMTVSNLFGEVSDGWLCLYIRICHILVYCNMFFGFCNGAFHTLMFANVVPLHWSCQIWANLTVLWWHIAKVCLYYIYMLRLQIAFRDSVFKYSKRTMTIAYSAIALYTVVCFIGDFTQIRGEWLITESGRHYCQAYMAVWGIILTAIFDGIVSALCLFLFLKPLYTLLSLEYGSVDRNHDLLNTIIKYTVLTVFAMGSTLLYLAILLWLHWGAISGIDNTVNSLCVVLMSALHSRTYDWLCCLCHRSVMKFNHTK